MAGEATFSLLASLMALALWWSEAHRDMAGFRGRFTAKNASYLPFLITLSALVVLTLNRALWDLNIIRAFASSLLTLSLTGSYLRPDEFRRSLPLGFFLCALVPLEKHVETFIGFPLRYLTAEGARLILQQLHFTVSGAATILVLENAASSVDAVCSGVKTIWAGLLFFLLLSYAKGSRVSLRWLGAGTVTLVLLIAANFLRVFILSFVALVVKHNGLFTLLHLPLGAFGFVSVCLVASRLLQRTEVLSAMGMAARKWHAPTAAACALLISLGAAFALQTGNRRELPITTPKAPEVVFPAAMAMTPLPMTQKEILFFAQNGGAEVGKWRFSVKVQPHLSGELILSSSRSWAAQHDPKQCLLGSGFLVKGQKTVLLDPQFPVKVLELQPDHRFVYWFQSADFITEEFSHRFWDGLLRRNEWTLVAVLFDDAHVDIATQETWFQTIRAAVARSH
jgi:exosortase O